MSVNSSAPDPNPANNSSTLATTVYTAPGISAQPTNQVTGVGGNAAFYVSATGTAPLNYQWTFGGGVLAGATTNALALANVQAGQAGNYAVVVSNSAGSITSAVATLTVLVPSFHFDAANQPDRGRGRQLQLASPGWRQHASGLPMALQRR